MNPLLFLLVLFCASALGGTSRFLLTDATEKHFKSIFPAGTMIVNVTGAFLIGLLSKVPWESFGSPIAKDVRLLLITGALGGFTTVSDRKSTRLNSSHVAISYAVFCLKKTND